MYVFYFVFGTLSKTTQDDISVIFPGTPNYDQAAHRREDLRRSLQELRSGTQIERATKVGPEMPLVAPVGLDTPAS